MGKLQPLPRALGTTFSTRLARDQGVSPDRLRASDLTHPFRAVHSSRSPRTLDDRCDAYLRRAGSDEYFSHATAARLWGLPLPAPLEARQDLDVSVSLPAHPPQARGVRGHRLQRPVRPVRLRGLPVVRPVECWIELAAELGVVDLTVLGDALVRREHPLASMSELAVAVAAARRVRGVVRLRSALARVRPGTDSPKETELRLLLVDAGLPEPLVGYEVVDGAAKVGTPDLAYPAHRIALEYEGDDHRTNQRTFRRDIERKERFHDAGWRTIRCTAEHLEDRTGLVHRVRRALGLR